VPRSFGPNRGLGSALDGRDLGLFVVQAKFGRRHVAERKVRTTSVVSELVEPTEGRRVELAVNVVDVCETPTTPRGEKPVHWRLLTNHSVASVADVQRVWATSSGGASKSCTRPGKAAHGASKKPSYEAPKLC